MPVVAGLPLTVTWPVAVSVPVWAGWTCGTGKVIASAEPGAAKLGAANELSTNVTATDRAAITLTGILKR